jgi:peptide/nickel transport system substrate-binding protein
VGAATRAGDHPAVSTGTFVVASTSGVQKLDPDIVTNFVDFQALGLVYDQLVRYSSTEQFVPDLATSWAFSDGNRAITFQLRHGVSFDDGTSFTSANVVASLDRVLAPKTGDASASYLASVKSIVAKGPYAVELVLKSPDASILSGLTSVNLSILSAKAIAAKTVATQPDGTGPFEFVSWSPNNNLVLKANPNYWGGKVKLSSVRVEAIPTEQSIAAAIQANTVQVGLITNPEITKTLTSFTVQKVLDLSYRALMLQDKTGPLANVNNRRALECAINRTQIVDDSVFGQGQVVGPVPIGPFASKPVSAVCPTTSVSKAKSYLRTAGDPSGFSFTAITSTDLDPTSAAQATAAASELAQAGITMHISNLAGDTYIQDWLKGTFQAAFAWNGADPDPYTMYGRYFGPGANLGVPAGYSSKSLQTLLVDGDEASSPALRQSYYSALSANLTSNAVWVWLFTSYDYAVLGRHVSGFTFLPSLTDSLSTLASTSVS